MSADPGRSARPDSAAPESPPAGRAAGRIEVYAGSGRVASQAQESGAAAPGPPCSYSLAYGALDAGGFATPYRSMATREFVDGPGPGVEMWVVERCPPGEGYGTYRWVPSAAGGGHQRLDRRGLRAGARPGAGAVAEHQPAAGGRCAGATRYLAGGRRSRPAQRRRPGRAGVGGGDGPADGDDLGDGQRRRRRMRSGSARRTRRGRPPTTRVRAGTPTPRIGDAGIRQVTATANWSVQLTTSTGRNEMLDPVTASTTFDYEVYEIVTVVEG